MDEKAAKVAKRARQRATGCRKRSDEHAISYQRWNWWARFLAITTAGLAGLGGIGAITSAKGSSLLAILGGGLVVLMVLIRAVDEGLGAARTAEGHRLAAVRFREIQLLYLTFGNFPPDDGTAAEEKFLQIQSQAVQVEADSPLVEQKSRLKREQLEKEEKERKKQEEAEEQGEADS